MTSEMKEQYVADQVRALATVLLTRRGDLTIAEAKKVTGLELQVSIEREDKPMRLTFGVVLRGVAAPQTAEQANRTLDPTLGQFRGMRKFTYPVCLFFFTLRDELAFFSWLAEPVVTNGAPKLIHHDKARCTPLTGDLLGRVVEQIVTWYDSVEAMLIA